MSLSVDLHCHSYHSDGSLAPAELVKRAHQQGVNVLALTDHDELDGLSEARREALKLGVYFVNGVEVSVSWEATTIHIVGLGFNPNDAVLKQGLESIRQERIRRAKKIAEKLEKCGIPNVWQEVTEEAGFESVTRTHFARYLVDNGHAKDMQQAFKRWLGRKGKAFVSGHWVTLSEALQWIHNAGGVSVIAHPIRYKMTNAKMEKLIKEFKQHGGTGIEVVASRYTVQDKAYVASLARRYDLLASVGSDFHSPGNPYIELGQNLELPIDCRPLWEDWNIGLKANVS